jgi:hypothetical protein
VARPLEIETPHLVRTVSSVFLPLAKADMKHLIAREVKQLSNITSQRREQAVLEESGALAIDFRGMVSRFRIDGNVCALVKSKT